MHGESGCSARRRGGLDPGCEKKRLLHRPTTSSGPPMQSIRADWTDCVPMCLPSRSRPPLNRAYRASWRERGMLSLGEHPGVGTAMEQKARRSLLGRIKLCPRMQKRGQTRTRSFGGWFGDIQQTRPQQCAVKRFAIAIELSR